MLPEVLGAVLVPGKPAAGLVGVVLVPVVVDQVHPRCPRHMPSLPMSLQALAKPLQVGDILNPVGVGRSDMLHADIAKQKAGRSA